MDIELRPYAPGDAEFVGGLVERFSEFELPPWRTPADVSAGTRREWVRQLGGKQNGVFPFVAIDKASGERAGFIVLLKMPDFFTSGTNCYISDMVVAHGADSRGVGSAMLGFAERFAREQGCERLALAVFPGNARARALYERHGFGVELLRMVKPLAR
jgi:ribosomal protein S18 acetylase RimI-like enzyme